eukprot:TRINITY_DN5193_c0_g1_i4.p1 TRINITY_DN5193_c0_g1~~TRINITY_DN5193_c0_g1_i4.p1  ORF type:complete len:373 (+),score=41.87 TRINITY_DN5193_c0_g1_i4:1391-2509(+)
MEAITAHNAQWQERPHFIDANSSDVRKPDLPKKKRYARRVNQACFECQKSHVSCDNARPCRRCIERDRTCLDGVPRKARRKRSSAEVSSEVIQGLNLINEANPALFDQMMNQDSNIKNVMEMLRDNSALSVLDLPEDTLGSFSEVFLSSYDSLQQTRNMTAGEWLAKSIQRIISRVRILEQRTPDLAERMKPYAQVIVSAMETFIKQFNLESTEKLMDEIRVQMGKSIAEHEGMSAPVILWAKGTNIEWANQAFRNLTGFHFPVPDEDISILDILSPDGARQALLSGLRAFISKTPGEMYNCGIQNFHESGPEYIEGTFSISQRRNDWGCPLVFIGIFLPSRVEPLTYDNLDWDALSNAIEQRCTIEDVKNS